MNQNYAKNLGWNYLGLYPLELMEKCGGLEPLHRNPHDGKQDNEDRESFFEVVNGFYCFFFRCICKNFSVHLPAFSPFEAFLIDKL